jgi:Endonuclease/Exonuclease/phosphatase family
MRKILLLIAGLSAATGLFSQAPRPLVILDGEFDDWNRLPAAVLVADANDANVHVDFRELRATADDRYIYVSFTLERSIALQTIAEGTVSLLVDEDGSAATGRVIRGLDGVDQVLQFGQGVVVRRYRQDGADSILVPNEDTGVLFAPRFASTRFELRLDRGTGRRATLKLVFEQSGAVRDETEAVAIALPPKALRPGPDSADRTPAVDPLQRPPGSSFRAVVWNVFGLPAARRGKVGRILRAIDADVVLLTELSSATTSRPIEFWLNSFNERGRAPWQVIVGTSGGQLSAVALRARLDRAFEKVAYPPDTVTSLVTFLSPDVRWNIWAVLQQRGVGVTGASGSVAERRLLTVALDLTSSGGPDSFNDAARISEAAAIAGATQHAAHLGSVEGVIIGGDFNLVGSRDPLDVLQRGLDVDRSALTAVPALQLDGRSNATWRALFGGSQFTPGRLDWLLYSDSALELLGSFAFDAADLSPDWLAQHRLVATDSLASDHLPVVADFRWRRLR